MFLFAGLLLPRNAFSSVCVYRPILAAAGPADLTVMVYFYHRETMNSLLKPSLGSAVSPHFPC